MHRLQWLAPIFSSEALPGRGLKCWLAVPAARMHGLPSDLLAGIISGGSSIGHGGGMPDSVVAPAAALHPAPADAALQPGAGASSPSSDGSGPAAAPAVEVRLAIGNRRLMAEEGVDVGTQASHTPDRGWPGLDLLCPLCSLHCGPAGHALAA